MESTRSSAERTMLARKRSPIIPVFHLVAVDATDDLIKLAAVEIRHIVDGKIIPMGDGKSRVRHQVIDPWRIVFFESYESIHVDDCEVVEVDLEGGRSLVFYTRRDLRDALRRAICLRRRRPLRVETVSGGMPRRGTS